MPQLSRKSGRFVIFCVGAAAAAAVALGSGAGSVRGDRSDALVRVLAERGMVTTPDKVQWLDPVGGVARSVLGTSRAIVVASPNAGDPTDVFLVYAKLSPNGGLLSVSEAYDLSDTSGAEESLPAIHGDAVAYVATSLVSEGAITAHVLDLGGQPPVAGPGWGATERAQNALTNLQKTGSLRGVGKRVYAVVDEPSAQEADKKGEPAGEAPAAGGASVAWSGGGFVLKVGAREAPLGEAASLPGWLELDVGEAVLPGGVVQWSVDRVRAVIGDDAMQTIKAVAFTALDFVIRQKESVTGDSGAEDIAADLGKNELDPPTRTIPIDPEIGWPPAPLEAYVTPALPGEGAWNAKDDDPFIRTNPGLPPAFLTTFVRTDRERRGTRVYVTLWDPRQVELHMMAGTVEPKGATGQAGPGMIPRTPEVMRRVVAASNAGFQALHGEFGMMADGVVYLPPKPYGATVLELRDGSTAFGTWPDDATIPESVLSYRQNMTVMVQDEKFNPYGRTWWGGTPPGWADKTHTVRTGICLTRERFVAYFYGADLSPNALAQGMIQARCSFGLALDMNAGHSGLEFYRVEPESEYQPLDRPLQRDWEAEGDVPRMEGWKYRGRRLVRGMGLMDFPRYIKREARDYFYMTLRHVIPGNPITPIVQPPEEGEGAWKISGLPQHGFPYAIATTHVRLDASKPGRVARVLEMDPRTVRVGAGGDADKLVALVGPGEAADDEAPPVGDLSLFHAAGAFSIAASAPAAGASSLATGSAKLTGSAAVGIHDESGMLYYVTLDPPRAEPTRADSEALDALLKNLGCARRMILARPLALALGGDTDLAGKAMHAPTGRSVVRLVRAEAAGGRRVFEDTPVVPLSVWYPLQQKRIRYFKEHPKPEAGDE